jgi:hypothetical protein
MAKKQEIIVRKRGQQPHVPNDVFRSQVKELAEAGWTVERLSAHLKMSEPTFRKYYAADYKEGNSKCLGQITEVLYQVAKDKDHKAFITANIFVHKTQMGWKEVSRTEVTGTDGGPIQLARADAYIDPHTIPPEAREQLRLAIEAKMAEIEGRQDGYDDGEEE